MAKRKVHPNSIAALRKTAVKKGEIRNPEGARSHNPELKRLRRLTKLELAEIGSALLKGNVREIEAIIEDSDLNPDSKHSAIKVWIAGIALRGIRQNEMGTLDGILDRLVGKVPDEIELSGKGGKPIEHTTESDEERKLRFMKLREQLKETDVEAGEAPSDW